MGITYLNYTADSSGKVKIRESNSTKVKGEQIYYNSEGINS